MVSEVTQESKQAFECVADDHLYTPSGRNREGWIPFATAGILVGILGGAVVGLLLGFVVAFIVGSWLTSPFGTLGIILAYLAVALGYVLQGAGEGWVAGWAAARFGLRRGGVRNVRSARLCGVVAALGTVGALFLFGLLIVDTVERDIVDYIAIGVVPIIAAFAGGIAAGAYIKSHFFCERCGVFMNESKSMPIDDPEGRAHELLKEGKIAELRDMDTCKPKDFTSRIDTQTCPKCGTSIVELYDRSLEGKGATIALSARVPAAKAPGA